MQPLADQHSNTSCTYGWLTGNLLGIFCHKARFGQRMNPNEFRKLAFLGVQVLKLLETNVPQTIMVKFEMALRLREILVAFVIDVLRDSYRRGR